MAPPNKSTASRRRIGNVAGLAGLAAVFLVLWNGTQYSTWKNTAVLADSSAFHNGYITTNPSAFSYLYIAMYNGEGVYFGIGSNLCIGVYVGERMGHVVDFLGATFLRIDKLIKMVPANGIIGFLN